MLNVFFNRIYIDNKDCIINEFIIICLKKGCNC